MLSASDRRILVLILILAVLSGFLIATADTGLNDPVGAGAEVSFRSGAGPVHPTGEQQHTSTSRTETI